MNIYQFNSLRVIQSGLSDWIWIENKPGGEYQKENRPLKERIVDDVMDDGAEEIPLSMEPGVIQTWTTSALEKGEINYYAK